MTVSFLIIIAVTLALIIYGLIEFRRHQKNIYSIPLRIHVNGTRGKSSVTRLIGAGLRAGGISSITKVTGTFPRLILEDGSEAAIHRKEKANILEQLNVVKFAAQREVEALIIECMALQPKFQWITEHQMVHANIGVITNVRLDHLDVMGPGIDNVAKALSGTIPRGEHFFTSEDRSFYFLKKVAEKRKSVAHQAYPEMVSDEDMEGFGYIEHKENVALALQICAHLKIDRTAALAEMKKMIPDEGVLLRHTVKMESNRVNFYNAFAANDPESSLMIWNSIMSTTAEDEYKVVLLTTRHDRMDRAKQLIQLIAEELDFDLALFIGESPHVVNEIIQKNKIEKEKYYLSHWDNPNDVFQGISDLSKPKTTIVGIGNMGAMGSDVAKLFEENHLK